MLDSRDSCLQSACQYGDLTNNCRFCRLSRYCKALCTLLEGGEILRLSLYVMLRMGRGGIRLCTSGLFQSLRNQSCNLT